MFSEQLRYQEFALRILENHFRQGRVAHTYLICGEKGAGHEGVAKTFAAALVHGDGKTFGSVPESVFARIERGQHPDVRLLGEDEDAASIKIEAVRDMIAWTGLKPFEADWKVLIVPGAERLTMESQNALLKTLEEPPARTVFLLLTVNKKKLLETIESRAFELRLHPAPTASGAKISALSLDGKKWEDLFDSWLGKSRQELGENMEGLALFFRDRIESLSAEQEPEVWAPYLKAIDSLYESREAIEANANQKLVMTRLAVKMKQVLPDPDKVVL